MPSWVTDEDAWQTAKKSASEQGRSGDWEYVAGIYKKIVENKKKSKKMKKAVEPWRLRLHCTIDKG